MDDETPGNVNVLVEYINDEGDQVRYYRTLTPPGLAAVLMAMDDGMADE